MRLRPRGPITCAAVVAVVLSCGEIREDEMMCEEAVSHLEECCPKIDPRRYNCVHQDSCGNRLDPVFSVSASHCVIDRPCEVLQQSGICEGLRQLSYEPYPFQHRRDFEEESCR